MNAAVTDGIVSGFDEGLLTSTSLLSNAPDATRALDRWKRLESRRCAGGLRSAGRRARLGEPAQPFDLGVHLNLTQGQPLTSARYPTELLDANGHFPGIFGLFRQLHRARPAAIERVEEELAAQVEFMLDCAHHPAHLNGHQYIELLPRIGPIIERLLTRYRIPVVRVACEPSWLRSFVWPGVRAAQWLLGGAKKYYAHQFRLRMKETGATFAYAFFGTMTAGTTTVATIRAMLAALKGSRLTEIGLHPALNSSAEANPDDAWHDPLRNRRPRELEMLVSSELEELLLAHNCRLGRLAFSGIRNVSDAAHEPPAHTHAEKFDRARSRAGGAGLWIALAAIVAIKTLQNPENHSYITRSFTTRRWRGGTA